MSKKKAKVIPVQVQRTPEPTVEQAPQVEPNTVPEVQNDNLQSAVVAANAQMGQKAHEEVVPPSTGGFDAYGEPSIDAPVKELHPVQKEASIK